MKKLSLKNLNLGASDLLQRNQLKTVFGGDGGYTGGGTCAYYLPSGSITVPFGGTTAQIHCPCTRQGVSRQEAESATNGVSGAMWCCDSCDTVGWL